MDASFQPTILYHGEMYLTTGFSCDSKFLFAASQGAKHGEQIGNGPLRLVHTPALAIIWNTTDWTEQSRIKHDYFHSIAAHPNQYILATSNHRSVTLWDMQTGKERRELSSSYSQHVYYGLSFSESGQWLAVGSEDDATDHAALLLDTESGDVVHRLMKEEDDRAVLWIRLLPDGKRVAGFGYTYDSTDYLYVWEVDSGKRLGTFRYDDEDNPYVSYIKLQMSPTGRYVAANYTGQVWELEAHRDLQWNYRYSCNAHPYGCGTVQFSPDERLLVTQGPETLTSEGDDTTSFSIRLWDVSTGQRHSMYTLPGRCFCFTTSPDSRLLAAMSAEVQWGYDGAAEYILSLWDIPSGQMLAQMSTESKKTNQLYHYPTNITFSPNGQYLAVSHLKHLEIWNVEQFLGI